MMEKKRNKASGRTQTDLAGGILLVCLVCLMSLTGCLASSPSQAVDLSWTPLSSPHPDPTPSARSADDLSLLTVVGLTADESLPIFSEPDPGAAIKGYLLSASTGIQSLEEDFSNPPGGLTQIAYQGTPGWVDRSHLAIQEGELSPQLAALGQLTALILKEKDLTALGSIIHPQDCLRFAPYPTLSETDQVFCSEDLPLLLGSAQPLIWGQYDGSGEPIQLTFREYYDRFIYDRDYFQPEIVGFNQEVSVGNALNNIPQVFPDGIMVEYYFPGFDPQYGGMDWRSLRLVFINRDGGWYLAALVHGEWTI